MPLLIEGRQLTYGDVRTFSEVHTILPRLPDTVHSQMAKIVTLCANKTYIVPALGPMIRGQYSKGQGPRIRGISFSGSPQRPGRGRLIFSSRIVI